MRIKASDLREGDRIGGVVVEKVRRCQTDLRYIDCRLEGSDRWNTWHINEKMIVDREMPKRVVSKEKTTVGIQAEFYESDDVYVKMLIETPDGRKMERVMVMSRLAYESMIKQIRDAIVVQEDSDDGE